MPLLPFIEENFGILTDDDVYLDSILIKPANLTDDELKVLRVWVPKYPLDKQSLLTCARQEVQSYGVDSKIAHLVFDLRGTGDSDGISGDYNFQLDMRAVADWAHERFGRINFGFLGHPNLEKGVVHMWPLRAGVSMESYYFRGATADLHPPCILYFSVYGNFSREDDQICYQLAQQGYDVYGVDPLRYLLHASAIERLTREHIHQDIRMLVQMLPNEPYLVAQPLASGLALLAAAGVNKILGVIAIGRAQSGLSPTHIFQNRNPHNFSLPQMLPHIAPRPLTLVINNHHAMGGQDGELAKLFKYSKEPHRLETTDGVNIEHLLEILAWQAAQNDAEHEAT